MEHIFPSVVACLLLVPIIWAVRTRVGLSYVGMTAAIALSFLFTTLVFLTKALFPLWQSVLISLMLGLCIAYLLQAKLAHHLFISQKEEAVTSTDEATPLYEQFTEKYTDNQTASLEKILEQPVMEEQVDIRDWEELFRQGSEEMKGGDIR